MFARRYFAGRYFAPRYWSESQGEAPSLVEFMEATFTSTAPRASYRVSDPVATFTAASPTATYRPKGA